MGRVEMPRYLPIGMVASGMILVPIIIAILFAPGAVDLLLFMAAIVVILVIGVSLLMQSARRAAPVTQPLPTMPDISTPADTSWDRGFQRGERERIRQEAYDPFGREPTCFSRWMNADRTLVRLFDARLDIQLTEE